MGQFFFEHSHLQNILGGFAVLGFFWAFLVFWGGFFGFF